EPDVQRNLCGFSSGTHEEQERDGYDARVADAEISFCEGGADIREANRAEERGRHEDAEEKTGVADAVDDEGFLACIGGGFLVEVKSDEQIAARAHAFPADEEQEEVIGEYQHQHGEHEEIQVAEEAVVAAFVRHVAGGVDVNQETDAGDDEDN